MLKILMALTREDVQRVAILARLRLTPAEEERLTEQLDSILRYMEKLNQLDTSGVEPFTHAVGLVNALRDEKLLTVGAGDNVVRFLAPLIVSEAEIDQSIICLERACVALSGGQLKKAAG